MGADADLFADAAELLSQALGAREALLDDGLGLLYELRAGMGADRGDGVILGSLASASGEVKQGAEATH
jgi:hypothetical protein